MNMNKKLVIFGIFLVLSLNLILAECGDAICDTGEEETCPDDCMGAGGDFEDECGDAICGPNEEETCPEDCELTIDGQQTEVCGDAICDAGEEETCPDDCSEADILAANTDNTSTIETGIDVENETEDIETTSGVSEEIQEKSFLSSKGFIFVLVFLLLVIFGIMGFLIWKIKKGLGNDDAGAVQQNNGAVQQSLG